MILRSLLCATSMALATFVAASPVARATGHDSVEDLQNLAEMEIIPGWKRDDGWYMAAIRVRLAPGWKTYWRQPGANGIAPRFDWSGSSNLDQVGYFWPTPDVFNDYGTRTIGYEAELVLPVLLKPRDDGKQIGARLTMEYGVCKDICVPVRSSHGGSFGNQPAANRAVIEKAVSMRPRSGRAAGMTAAKCNLSRDGNVYVLTAQLDFSTALKELRAVVVESGSSDIWVSAADHQRNGTRLSIEADLQNYGGGPMALRRENIRFTLIGPDHSVDIRGCEAG